MIQWSESLSVGIPLIDEQHKELFAAVNALFRAVGEGHGREEIDKTVAFLSSYVNEHFRTEEEYMERTGYPGYAAHKADHDYFRQLAGKLTGLERERDPLLNERGVLGILYSWLLNHVSKTDKAMGEFLKGKV